ncbi:MAG TPA: hypothetical protein VFO86_13775 [Terriglobia bacterium]|nr:hypothetical protein [Terriglobia bacterium]
MHAIIMFCVIRTTTFIATLLFAASAFAQVPPGVSYDPGKHPNPIVTYIKTKDFRPTTYADAMKLAGFDPLGLSEKEGERKTIEIAEPKPASQKIELPNDEFPLIKVEYFPVFRQTYVLKSGVALVLDAFKFPKVPIPMNDLTGVLNSAAFRPGEKYWKPRFGQSTVPERTNIRGVAALLFDDNHEFVLFWREGTECYVIKTKASRADLLRIAADLL